MLLSPVVPKDNCSMFRTVSVDLTLGHCPVSRSWWRLAGWAWQRSRLAHHPRSEDKFGIHHHNPNRRKFILLIDEMVQIEVQLYISTLEPNVRKLILISTNMRYRYFLAYESILTGPKLRTQLHPSSNGIPLYTPSRHALFWASVSSPTLCSDPKVYTIERFPSFLNFYSNTWNYQYHHFIISKIRK